MNAIARMRRSRRWPSRWPIRWKLAAVSSGLTFIILVAFGLAVGQFTTQQLRDNYAAETESTASDIARKIEENVTSTPGYGDALQVNSILAQANGPARYNLFANQTSFASPGAPDFGEPPGEGIRNVGDYQVATKVVQQGQAYVIGFVQFGRKVDRLNQSIDRVWISVLAGTLAATLLAAMAGVVLSRRAMRPVSNLTSAAREIARTRDPSVTLREPVADDEVTELTRTLNGMFRELSLARIEREKSLTRQREFIADASHELRTPLTSVMANLELLDDALEGSASREMEQESVESALRSSRRMRRLVSDLQILARADSGRTRTHEPCDLARIASNAVNELQPLAEHHQVTLESTGDTTVDGNSDDLHRVVVNLIDNAARHTPGGTVITVSVTGPPDSGSVRLAVADDGPGIPDELRKQIFNRFVRNTEPGDRSSSKGSGLGLAIVQAIAAEHHGNATVGDSAEGGAMFTVELPTAENKPKETVNAPLGPV